MRQSAQWSIVHSISEQAAEAGCQFSGCDKYGSASKRHTRFFAGTFSFKVTAAKLMLCSLLVFLLSIRLCTDNRVRAAPILCPPILSGGHCHCSSLIVVHHHGYNAKSRKQSMPFLPSLTLYYSGNKQTIGPEPRNAIISSKAGQSWCWQQVTNWHNCKEPKHRNKVCTFMIAKKLHWVIEFKTTTVKRAREELLKRTPVLQN